MTEVVDRIKAIKTNDRHVSKWVDYQTTFTIYEENDPILRARVDTLSKYNINVTLGASVLIPEHNYDQVGSMITNVKRAVIEELYGEFRKPLIELEIVIAEGRQQEALEKVRNVYRTMFGLEG